MVFDTLADSSPLSPLSSLGSVSPAPTDFYPSPSSSQELFGPDQPKNAAATVIDAPIGDGIPVAKKRKMTEPKPRVTEYLNFEPPSLKEGGMPEEHMRAQKPQLDRLIHILRKKKKIVVIAGAGISVSAGVPDFRSSTGLFSTLRNRHNLKASGKHLFDASVYKTDASTSSFHDMVRSLSQLVTTARPTVFHHLLATLAKEGRLLRLYTQNVDGIDTSLPPLKTKVPLGPKGPWPQTVQLHGGLGKMVCQKCNSLSDFEAALFDGPEPPSCPECEQLDLVRTNIAGKRSHGIGKLRPRIVLYNEHNPDDEAIGAVTRADLKSRPDAVIVVGTTLKVPGVRRIVREMCGVTRGRRDGVAIWINNGPEPSGREFEDCWDLVVRGDCDEVARQAGFKKWDDKSDEYEEIGDEAWKKIKRESDEPKVVIQTPSKRTGLKQVQGVLTPIASPRLKGSNVVEVHAQAKFVPKSILRGPAKDRNEKVPTASTLLTRTNKKSRRRPTRKPAQLPTAPKGANSLKQAFKVKKTTTVRKGSKSLVSKGSTNEAESISNDFSTVSGGPNPALSSPLPPMSLSPILPMRPTPSPRSDTAHPSADKSHADGMPADEEVQLLHRESTLSPQGPLPQSLAMLMND
ncbi:MAG: hypothetical protein M1837_005615 [Sclerophora amabilis]|nr:MAG: hypothetical protein M1837_005615 [Sclerophora amabilis]